MLVAPGMTKAWGDIDQAAQKETKLQVTPMCDGNPHPPLQAISDGEGRISAEFLTIKKKSNEKDATLFV